MQQNSINAINEKRNAKNAKNAKKYKRNAKNAIQFKRKKHSKIHKKQNIPKTSKNEKCKKFNPHASISTLCLFYFWH